jgi:HAD superfamily, subfamily IIIB (Acid phosphatase)
VPADRSRLPGVKRAAGTRDHRPVLGRRVSGERAVADGVCTTIEYKSLTRKHLVDDLHYDVVANVGDQFSDLIAGYADPTVKLPNPTYYLP